VSNLINKLIEDLKLIPEIEAISIGGSRATNNFDSKSDYDVYLYCKGSIDENIRRNILSKYCKYIEISNHFWELEDNCTLNDDIDIDILYRNIDDFDKTLNYVVNECNPYNGYTTCMWHNLLTCKIVYDRDLRLTNLKNKYNIPYPKSLKENIISNNLKLLRNTLPAYNLQIRKALNREDIISISHRSSAFMESYFDIIWALNELTHPGEKRLIQLCLKHCKILPNNFEQNLNEYFKNLYVNYEKAYAILETIIKELELIL
jgi:hypothetical protein